MKIAAAVILNAAVLGVGVTIGISLMVAAGVTGLLFATLALFAEPKRKDR